MSAPKVGDQFPKDVSFPYIPASKEIESFKTCGMIQQLKASEQWANKKVVLFALPGAFTPTCSAQHVPDYIKKLPELKKKGVDVVAVIACNDPYVMSAWGKANGVHDDSLLFLTDEDCKFSARYGWAEGGRTDRYAMIIDHGKIVYAEKEKNKQAVTVSGVDAILEKL